MNSVHCFVQQGVISDADREDLDAVFRESAALCIPRDRDDLRASGAATVMDTQVATGVARRVLLEDGRELTADNFRARGELLQRARASNRTSFADVEAYAKENVGRCFGLDQHLDVRLYIGESESMDPAFNVTSLLGYACTSKSSKLSVIGRIVFGSGVHGNLTVIYSSGDRCYVHSADTDLLYIVSEGGISELLCRDGHRHIYEMFDRPMLETEEVGVPLCMRLLASFTCSDDVRCFVRDHVGMSTYRQLSGSHCVAASPFGYFMVGDERGLHLGQVFPDRVFVYLHVAGYWVLGRTEMELIVVYNDNLEVFLLLDRGRLLKIANTIMGFLRDRLRVNLQPYRRCFRRNASDASGNSRLCIGQIVEFHCGVGYVIPGDDELVRWLAREDRKNTVEHCIPIL